MEETNNEFEIFAKDLGIDYSGTMDEASDTYTIGLDNSDIYASIYSLLDNSDKLSIEPNLTLLNEDISELNYANSDYLIKLIGNFKDDDYKVIIERNQQ